MEKIYLNPETRKIIESKMSKKIRQEYKNGRSTFVMIKRTGKPLIKWGDAAVLIITKNGSILEFGTSLKEWDENPRHLKDVIDYFVYGEKNEYKVMAW